MNLIIFLALVAACCGVTLCDDIEQVRRSSKSTATVTTTSVKPHNQITVSSEMTTTNLSTTTIAPTTAAPPNNIWTVSYPKTGRICILLSANITLTYNNTKDNNTEVKWTVPLPENGSSAEGTCGSNTESITIKYSDSHTNLSLKFSFVMNKSMYHMNSFSLTATIDKITMDATKNVSDFWSEDKDRLNSYLCNTTETLYDSSEGPLLKLTVSDMKLEAFQNTTKPAFSNPVTECKQDRTISNLVPIIVGAALGGLILVVLIAYLIGRRRSRRGYEQV